MSRAALFQNFLRTDRFKHNFLAHSIDYIWRSTKAKQRPYADSGHTGDSTQASFYQIGFCSYVLTSNRISMSYTLNVHVCHERHKVTSRTTQRTRCIEVTGSAFLLEPLSQFPRALLTMCHGRVRTLLPLPPECPGYKPVPS